MVNEETLFTIIQSIKNLESLFNNMKSSILIAVESKLQEMKSTLVSAIDNAKTYSEAVQKQRVIIDSSSTDVDYFNNTTDTTTDGNSSQTLLKTIYTSTTSTVTTETVRPTPRHHRNANMGERNDNMLHDNHRQQNVNRSPATPSTSSSTKRTLLIGDSILSPTSLKSIVKGVKKKTFKKGAKISDIVEDITPYKIK